MTRPIEHNPKVLKPFPSLTDDQRRRLCLGAKAQPRVRDPSEALPRNSAPQKWVSVNETNWTVRAGAEDHKRFRSVGMPI